MIRESELQRVIRDEPSTTPGCRESPYDPKRQRCAASAFWACHKKGKGRMRPAAHSTRWNGSDAILRALRVRKEWLNRARHLRYQSGGVQITHVYQQDATKR